MQEAVSLTGTRFGRYKVGEFLHADGECWYFVARPRLGGSPVELEMLSRKAARSRSISGEFQAVSAILAGVRHPNIRVVRDLGEAEGIPYRAYHGKGTRPVQSESGELLKLTCEQALASLSQLASAVQALHQAGVAHLNLTPASVVLSHDGQAILGGFSRCRVLASAEDGQSRWNPFSKPPDDREDQIQLAHLFDDLLGAPFRRGGESAATSGNRAVDEVLARMLAEDPDERYVRMVDVVNLLNHAMRAPDAAETRMLAPRSTRVLAAPSASVSPPSRASSYQPFPKPVSPPGEFASWLHRVCQVFEYVVLLFLAGFALFFLMEELLYSAVFVAGLAAALVVLRCVALELEHRGCLALAFVQAVRRFPLLGILLVLFGGAAALGLVLTNTWVAIPGPFAVGVVLFLPYHFLIARPVSCGHALSFTLYGAAVSFFQFIGGGSNERESIAPSSSGEHSRDSPGGACHAVPAQNDAGSTDVRFDHRESSALALARKGLGAFTYLFATAILAAALLPQLTQRGMLPFVPPPEVNALLQQYYQWGIGGGIFGIVLGGVLLRCGHHPRLIRTTIILAGTSLLVATLPIVELASAPQFSPSIANFCGWVLVIVGLGIDRISSLMLGGGVLYGTGLGR